ncbi:MAG: hypothetical protein HY519_00960 [Candidatus Aenigmarchaeota archaeon]|nr:hypothetical protein [Candidatus Aenigmarchaeota archaeon]
MLTRVQIIVILPILFAYLFYEKRFSAISKPMLLKAFVFLVSGFMIMAPYLYYRSANTGMSIFHQAIYETLAGQAAFSPTGKVGQPWDYYFSNSFDTFYFALPFFFAGLLYSWRLKDGKMIFPLLWFLIMFSVLQFFSVKGTRLLFPIFPAFMLIAVYGMHAIAKRRKVFHAVFAVVAILTALYGIATTSQVYAGHYPFEWPMWDFIRSLNEPLATQDLYHGTTIRMAYGTVKLLTGTYADFFHAEANEPEAILAAVRLNTPYILFAGNAERRQPLELVKYFQECNCSLYRIENNTFSQILGSGTVIYTLADGQPLDGARVSMFDVDGKLLYGGRSSKGRFLIPFKDGDAILSITKICYTQSAYRIRLENGRLSVCTANANQNVACTQQADSFEIAHIGCSNHKFPLDRF